MYRFLNINTSSFSNSDSCLKKEEVKVEEQKPILVNSLIQKSHILDMFGNSDIKISKKGFEIKSKMEDWKNKELQMCAQHQAKLEILKAKIGKEPTETMSEWTTEGFDVSIEPKTYCYEESDWSTSNDGTEGIEKQPIGALKGEYNSIAHDYVKCQKDIKTIDTMVSNLTDSISYQLTIRQAALLGF